MQALNTLSKAIFLLALVLSSSTISAQKYTAKKVLLLMGTRFEIGVYANNKQSAENNITVAIKEVQRIENLISSWKSNSQTSKINKNAGQKYVAVDEELFRLIQRAQSISTLSDGAFDLSAGRLDALYRFAGQDTTLPSQAQLDAAKVQVDYTNILLQEKNDSFWVKLEQPQMHISFGAIGKGYAANRAIALLKKDSNCLGAVVNAAGDLICFGENEQGNSWKIGITDPNNTQQWLGQIEVNNKAVVTSGNYEKYFTAQGQRFAHIIDPRTALPTTGIKSVTIVCPDAEIADALATTIFVLGLEQGLQLINQLKNIEGLIVDDKGYTFTSKGLKLEAYEKD